MGGKPQLAHPLPPSEYLLGGDEYFEEGFISGVKRPLGLGSFLTPPRQPRVGLTWSCPSGCGQEGGVLRGGHLLPDDGLGPHIWADPDAHGLWV